jgi:hypothetical protein
MSAARIVEHLAHDPGVMVVRCHARELPPPTLPSPVDLAALFSEPWVAPGKRHRSKKRRRAA